MTAAYSAASENTLVYESQSSNTISVINPIADHVLLAVTGVAAANAYDGDAAVADKASWDEDNNTDAEDAEDQGEEDRTQAETRFDLESISEELATILRAELRDMRWPDDI